MAVAGKINPKAKQGSRSIGLSLPGYNGNAIINFGNQTGTPNNVSSTITNPQGSLIVGNNITVTGATDRNIVFWSSDNRTTSTSQQLTLNAATDSVVIVPSSTASSSVPSLCTIIGGSPSVNSAATGQVLLGWSAQTNGNNAVAIGSSAVASSGASVAVGGSTSASGNCIALGSGAQATASMATTLGASATTGTNMMAVAIGFKATADFTSQISLSPSYYATQGDRQISFVTMFGQTTNATQLELGTSTNPGSSTITSYWQPPVPTTTSAYFCTAIFVGNRTDTVGSTYMQKVEFGFTVDSTAGSIALTGTPQFSTALTRGTTTGWAVTVNTSTGTNNRPSFLVTGASGATISWGCKVEILKVI